MSTSSRSSINPWDHFTGPGAFKRRLNIFVNDPKTSVREANAARVARFGGDGITVINDLLERVKELENPPSPPPPPERAPITPFEVETKDLLQIAGYLTYLATEEKDESISKTLEQISWDIARHADDKKGVVEGPTKTDSFGNAVKWVKYVEDLSGGLPARAPRLFQGLAPLLRSFLTHRITLEDARLIQKEKLASKTSELEIEQGTNQILETRALQAEANNKDLQEQIKGFQQQIRNGTEYYNKLKTATNEVAANLAGEKIARQDDAEQATADKGALEEEIARLRGNQAEATIISNLEAQARRSKIDHEIYTERQRVSNKTLQTRIDELEEKEAARRTQEREDRLDTNRLLEIQYRFGDNPSGLSSPR